MPSKCANKGFIVLVPKYRWILTTTLLTRHFRTTCSTPLSRPPMTSPGLDSVTNNLPNSFFGGQKIFFDRFWSSFSQFSQFLSGFFCTNLIRFTSSKYFANFLTRRNQRNVFLSISLTSSLLNLLL